MMRRALIMLLVCLVPVVSAAQGPDDDFDAWSLDAQDIGALQAGLALSGLYPGLIDGAWGRGSIAAAPC